MSFDPVPYLRSIGISEPAARDIEFHRQIVQVLQRHRWFLPGKLAKFDETDQARFNNDWTEFAVTELFKDLDLKQYVGPRFVVDNDFKARFVAKRLPVPPGSTRRAMDKYTIEQMLAFEVAQRTKARQQQQTDEMLTQVFAARAHHSVLLNWLRGWQAEMAAGEEQGVQFYFHADVVSRFVRYLRRLALDTSPWDNVTDKKLRDALESSYRNSYAWVHPTIEIVTTLQLINADNMVNDHLAVRQEIYEFLWTCVDLIADKNASEYTDLYKFTAIFYSLSDGYD